MNKNTIEKIKELALTYSSLEGFVEKENYNNDYSISYAFNEACRRGDHKTAQFLAYDTDLPYNASIYGYDAEGFSSACYSGSLNIVKLYMDYDTDPYNKQFAFLIGNNQALKYACKNNHVHLLKYFETIKSDNLKIEYTHNVTTTLNLENNKETLDYILYETDYDVDEETYSVFRDIFGMTDMVKLFDEHRIYREKLKFKEVLEENLESNVNNNSNKIKTKL